MAQAMHTGQLTLLEGLPYAENLRHELSAHHSATKERLTQVEAKDKIKAAIGHSPDFEDSLLAAWWAKTFKPPTSAFRVRTA